MRLTRFGVQDGFRWSVDGDFLAPEITLADLLSIRRSEMMEKLGARLERVEVEANEFVEAAVVEPNQEVWAAGVTYKRSLDERKAESASAADVYSLVYDADRPEIFFKSIGWRVVGHKQPIRVRQDSEWNVPEPELTLVVNQYLEIVGYTAGDDVSSRSIEGENPLYLPQAKSYDGSCAVGPSIVIASEEELCEVPIQIRIERGGLCVFDGHANTNQMKRSFRELVDFLGRELSFPTGVFLMTGTGIVPDTSFTLHGGDVVSIQVGELSLMNTVAEE